LFTVLLNPCPHKALAAMIDGLDLFGLGYSWGGFESLMIPFKPHRTATPSWTHKGPCIRVHAGLEHVDDLICDLEEGFTRLKAAQ
jgi:cystathionine beta-lyase